VLPPKYRLPLRYELQRVQKEGRVWQFPFFGLLVAENKRSLSRFSFIVSNKISRRATKRSKIKRLLRESVKTLLPQVKPGLDTVFLVKKGILDKDFQTVQSKVKTSFEKIGLL
jgi:ribonuclease P protein component